MIAVAFSRSGEPERDGNGDRLVLLKVSGDGVLFCLASMRCPIGDFGRRMGSCNELVADPDPSKRALRAATPLKETLL
jgi:hypothetical protein